ncbi:MAG: hypothetical protein A2Z46_04875 [Nitrospirae bacterium RBG_19FT_COMBO_55_12]|nr:MAG: hypothetical protein A2Z46_04875 [Nitrospirae bacterium RBG_19FT_COMBO_55_12]
MVLAFGKANRPNTILPGHADRRKNKDFCFSAAVIRAQSRRVKVQHEKRNRKANSRPWMACFPPRDGKNQVVCPAADTVSADPRFSVDFGGQFV